MPEECHRPVLMVEGLGDKNAVPLLIRRVLESHQIYDVDVSPNTRQKVDVPKLQREGELERYIRYSETDDCDCTLAILDCDDGCPMEVARDFSRRCRGIGLTKKIGFAFMKREFESMFLCCLPEIAQRYPRYGWDLSGYSANADFESIRDAKGVLSSYMTRGKIYKPTGEQASFVEALDFVKLRAQSRSFVHLERTLLWMVGQHRAGEQIYPIIA